MKTAQADILILPGLGGGDPNYWYERWRAKLSTGQRLEQADWNTPSKDEWCDRLIKALEKAERPVVLIAHSLGVITLVHAAPQFPAGKVRGAYLVAPPDMSSLVETFPETSTFYPVSTDPLPFPSVLVASKNDPFCRFEAAEDMAYAWGSRFESAGECGHINAESGQGPWPEGLLSFAHFMKDL